MPDSPLRVGANGPMYQIEIWRPAYRCRFVFYTGPTMVSSIATPLHAPWHNFAKFYHRPRHWKVTALRTMDIKIALSEIAPTTMCFRYFEASSSSLAIAIYVLRSAAWCRFTNGKASKRERSLRRTQTTVVGACHRPHDGKQQQDLDTRRLRSARRLRWTLYLTHRSVGQFHISRGLWNLCAEK